MVQTIGFGPHRLNIDTRPEWFFDDELNGGILCDIASHQIDQFLFFTKYNWKDGMSTLIFCEYAKHVNGKLFSCDINSQNIKYAKRTTKKFINYVNFVESDSLLFLKNFKHKIDFLYLDSLDGHNPSDASMHQLNEAKSAIDKLHRNSLILLDDKNLKTTQSLEFLLANKFNILNETDEQILLGY